MQFARADLVRSALRLLNDGEVWVPSEEITANIPISRFSDLGKIGPDIRDLWDGFERTTAVTAYPMIENHDTNKRRCISTKPDKYLAPLVEPPPGRRLKPVNQLWPKAGRLLVGARFWLNTVRVVAMRADDNVLGSMWWPVRVGDVQGREGGRTVWLNSAAWEY